MADYRWSDESETEIEEVEEDRDPVEEFWEMGATVRPQRRSRIKDRAEIRLLQDIRDLLILQVQQGSPVDPMRHTRMEIAIEDGRLVRREIPA